MYSRTLLAMVIGIGGLILAVPTAADQAQPKANAYDPSERICEKITEVGSRLAVKRVCMTRAQWEERRRDDRDAVDQAQRSPNVGCSTINTHSGTPGC